PSALTQLPSHRAPPTSPCSKTPTTATSSQSTSPHPRPNMCELTHLTFTCGHTQLSFSSRCPSASRRRSTPSHLPPDFCRAHTGITTPYLTTSPDPCMPSCRRKEALDALAKRYSSAKGAISKLVARAQKVEVCAEKMDAGSFTEKQFAKLEQEGWDAGKLVELCQEALSTLPGLLAEVPAATAASEADLEEAYAAAKASVRDYELVVGDEGETKELVAFDAGALVEARDGGMLYEVVCEIERRAEQACLEQVGWEGPGEDGVQMGVLRDLGAWKRGVLSGGRMDDAFIGKKRKVVYTA
ncbi:hypothetical protein P171DRAFT_511548, partial [Karstenula rhodostoma CBS 690.94]